MNAHLRSIASEAVQKRMDFYEVARKYGYGPEAARRIDAQLRRAGYLPPPRVQEL